MLVFFILSPLVTTGYRCRYSINRSTEALLRYLYFNTHIRPQSCIRFGDSDDHQLISSSEGSESESDFKGVVVVGGGVVVAAAAAVVVRLAPSSLLEMDVDSAAGPKSGCSVADSNLLSVDVGRSVFCSSAAR